LLAIHNICTHLSSSSSSSSLSSSSSQSSSWHHHHHTQGDKWQLFIPSELAYGNRQQGRYITPGAVLLFDIEIVKVKSGGYVRDTSGDL
jgi:hypothetical protein